MPTTPYSSRRSGHGRAVADDANAHGFVQFVVKVLQTRLRDIRRGPLRRDKLGQRSDTRVHAKVGKKGRTVTGQRRRARHDAVQGGPIRAIRQLGNLVATVNDKTVGLGWDGQPGVVQLNLEAGCGIRGQNGKGTPVRAA